MNIDIAALRAIEADKGVSIETVISTIQTALLTAYRHTEGHQPHAWIDVNRKTGSVRVMAKENRDLRLAAAEKKAAQLPAKLTVPMILFFLPVLFIVILGPAILNIMDTMAKG